MSAPSRSHDGRRNGSHQSTPRTPRPADSSSSSDGDSDARRSVRTPSLSRALAPTAGEADATPDVDEVIRRGRQLLRDLAPLSAGRRSAGGRSRADSRNSAITDDGRGDGGNYTLNTTGGDHAGPRHEGTSVPLSPHDRRPRYSVMPLAQSIGTPHARAAQYTLDERRAIVDAINTPGRRSVRGVRTPASVRARRASSEPAWQPGSARIRDDDGDFDDGPSTHGTHRRLLRPQLQQRETPRDTLRALSRLLRRGESEGPDLAGQARRSSDNGEDYARDAKGTSTANIRYSDQDDGLDPTPHRARSDLTDDASPPLVGHRSAGLEDRDDTDLGNESTAMEVARRQTNASLLRPTARRSSLAAALLLRDDNDDSRVGLGPKGGEDRRFSRAPSVVSDVTGLLPEWPSILGPVAADADVSGMKTGLPLVSASVQRVPKLAEHERVSDW